jgi:uncharacterized protein YjaG (DUF416 family)
MIAAIPTVDACVATANVVSELTSGRITHGVEMRVSKGFQKASVSVAFIDVVEVDRNELV